MVEQCEPSPGNDGTNCQLDSPTFSRHVDDMKTASAQEVPGQWNEILQWVIAGEEVQVTLEGKPVARLTPCTETQTFIGATVGGPALPDDLEAPTGEQW